VTLEQRRALVWIRDRQPVMPPIDAVPAPIRIALLRSGLIHFDPNRKRYDSPRYCLTDAGHNALQP
jgi:hypothetical protein